MYIHLLQLLFFCRHILTKGLNLRKRTLNKTSSFFDGQVLVSMSALERRVLEFLDILQVHSLKIQLFPLEILNMVNSAHFSMYLILH